MECAQTEWVSNREFLRRFQRKVEAKRVPLSGSIDLTNQCNLRCVHCYVGNKARSPAELKKELNTSQWIGLIDAMVDAGCLFLLITGGEPLMRKDFAEIYTHAKQSGLLVTVFTNGTLITDRILSLFDDLPPYTVEISLYGATAQTYERIAGVVGSYRKCLSGIERLLDLKVNLKLKTVLMTLNRHEFDSIEQMAKERGVSFRFDTAIFPSLKGDKTPLLFRVEPTEAVEKEVADVNRLRQWRQHFYRMQDLPLSDELFNCGAGLTTFHIDSYGHMKPCLMVQTLQHDLSQSTFSEGWNKVMPQIRARKVDPGNICAKCEKSILCGYCPAFFHLENGTEDIRSEYLCAIGQQRFEAIHKKTLQG